MNRVILASASPRRRELLEAMGYDVVVRPVDVNEGQFAEESPTDYLFRIVRSKMLASLGLSWSYDVADTQLAHATTSQESILVADTVVVCDGLVLQKPSDDGDSRAMLSRLSGRTHEVITRFAVAKSGFWREQSVQTHVTFRTIADDELAAYIATGEGRDKAGSYAIQGRAAKFIRKIDGSYGAVVGLPSCEVSEVLIEAHSPRK